MSDFMTLRLRGFFIFSAHMAWHCFSSSSSIEVHVKRIRTRLIKASLYKKVPRVRSKDGGRKEDHGAG
jgi:hypothetical protein